MGCSGSANAQGAQGPVPSDPSSPNNSDAVQRFDSKSSFLSDASSGASKKTGNVTVQGRYNRLPKRIEDDYDVRDDVLGSGYNGNVLLAYGRGQKNRGSYAIKAFRLAGVDQAKHDELHAELEVFLAVDHPNIVRLVNVFETEDMLYMVMECMMGGTMFERLQTCKSFSEQDAADITRQTLLAINYLHNRSIVHRDLKLENLMFASKKTNQIKLIDFGFSRLWDGDEVMTWNVGTLCHAAPEVLKKNYTSQCDLWSLGTIVYLLLSGKEPFSGTVKETMKAILSGAVVMTGEEWAHVSARGQSFVMGLLTVNPEKRLTAVQALQHPWIVKQASKTKQQETLLDKATVDGLVNFSKVSAFKRTCMMMMALSLTEEHEHELHDVFIAIDTDQTGLIKASEFKVVLQEHFDLHDEEVKKAFDAVDQYNDGVIHYSEFLAACMATRVTVCDDLLEAAFDRFDLKQNGVIEADELAQLLGSSFSKEQIHDLIRDATGSDSDHISFEAFSKYLRSHTGDELTVHVSNTLIDKEQVIEQHERHSKRSHENPLDAAEHPWHHVTGTFKTHSGALPSISGKLPSASGKLPSASGKLPSASGNLPSAMRPKPASPRPHSGLVRAEGDQTESI